MEFLKTKKDQIFLSYEYLFLFAGTQSVKQDRGKAYKNDALL